MARLTSRELVQRFEYYVASIESKLNNKDKAGSIIDSIPLSVVIARPGPLEIVNINKKHETWTGYSEEEIRQDCGDYLRKTIHPTSLKNVAPLLKEFYGTGHSRQTMAFVQYAIPYGKRDYDPLITFTKVPACQSDLAVRLLVPPNKMDSLSRSMEQIVEMDLFKMRHFKRFQQLGHREIQVLELLANGCNNPDIADQLGISRQTVETHRKRIKSKLELKTFRDLMRYAIAFDLVRF